ncbi:MAG: 3-deoxy-D-manno-octulosonic acid transferase [Candidatus Pelagibacter sp.]
MLFFYRTLINIIFFVSPIIIIYRLIRKKEDIKRFKEKFCFFSEKNLKGNLIWFHGASVGELQSIVPLIEKLERNKKIKKILVTSNTLSSSKVLRKLNFKKVIHQFFPIDTNFHSKKFLSYWKPSCAFFIDSEIWPNMYLNLKKNKIPTTLINGRITKKSFKRWKLFPSFSKKIFNTLDLCLSSSEKSKKYLLELGAVKVKFLGNLKFAQSENEKITVPNNLKKFFSSKKVWCASSTHNTEEKFCGLVHNELKKKYKNLLTIIIPRHIDRVDEIKDEMHKLNLKFHTHESNKEIKDNTDIYIVDTYGKTKTFYNLCKNVLLGGSLIKHGGQNPLEATRYGCNILHGPNIENFSEIYNYLKKNKISQKINSQKKLVNTLSKLLKKKPNSKRTQHRLKLIGQKILNSTLKEIKL